MEKALRVVPGNNDVSILSNQIARMSYTMPYKQRQILYLIFCHVTGDDSVREFEVKVADILQALGMPDGGSQYELIRGQVAGLMGHVLDLDLDLEPEGDWLMIPWVERASYHKGRKTVTIRLPVEILPFARSVGQLFTQIKISDIAKINSRHAIRLFELLMSWSSKAGKDGNPPGCWFWKVDPDSYRKHLAIKPGEYKLTADLKKWTIEDPVAELNGAGIGLQVTVTYERHGKYITNFLFKVKRVSGNEKENPEKEKGKKSTGKITGNKNEKPLREQYPEKWLEAYNRHRSQVHIPGVAGDSVAEGLADRELLGEFSSDRVTGNSNE